MKISKALITFCIILLPIIGVTAPRAFGFIPAVLGLVAFSEYIFTQKKLPKIDWALSGFFLVFFMLAGLSYFWSVDPDFTIKRVVKLIILVIPSILLLSTARSTKLVSMRFLRILPYSLIAASVLILIETYCNYPLYRLLRELSAEDTVELSVTNWGLIIISLLTWPVLYKLWLERNKAIIIIMLITIALAIFSATSQSAMVAFALGLFSLIISIKQPKLLLYAVGGGTIVGILSSPWIAQGLFDLRPEIFVKWVHASAAQRMELWDFIARKALESPWYGWGIEATRNIDDFDSSKIFFVKTNILHPHNFALQLWIELGLLGAISGMAFIVLCVKRFLKIDTRQLPFVISCFIAALVVNLVGYGMWQGWLIGLQFIAAFLFITFLKQDEKE